MEHQTDRQIGAACSDVVVKRELSCKAKFSIYQLIYVPTLTYGNFG